MISVLPGLFVTIVELETPNAPNPKPLSSGFSRGVAYQVLGAYSASETSESYFILSNDRNEIWFISNRHLRSWKLMPGRDELRVPAEQALRQVRAANAQG